MNDKLTAKTAKFMSLENLYVYGISVQAELAMYGN